MLARHTTAESQYIAKEANAITNPDIDGRTEAILTLANATPASFRAIRSQLDKSIDLKKLGLAGFHIDETHPVISAGTIPADKSPDHKADNVPGLLFTNDSGQQRVMIANGSEYAEKGNKVGGLVREADVWAK
jgi:hypothetical protein